MGPALRLARLNLYRIHDPRHDALSGTGAALKGGRWNPRGLPVVYTSSAYEGTMLEILARVVTRRIPQGYVASRIVLPDDCEVERLDGGLFPDWFDWVRSRRIGRGWAVSLRSLALEVPSYVAQPWGRNVLVNPRHADFGRVRVAEVVDVRWDPRMF